jgi:hypothetical protein
MQLVYGDCCVDVIIARRWAKICKDGKAGKPDLCRIDLGDLWQLPISFRGKGLMNSLKKIGRTLKEKLLSKLAFHKNVSVILLIFLDIGKFVHVGFLACSRQRWRL